jgi:toxin ParE1/3/4
MSRYTLTLLAAKDFAAIGEHIGAEHPRAAERLLTQILETFETLAENPGIGHIREDLTPDPFRFWSIGAYLIIYTVEADCVEVLRVVHGARDVRGLLES